MKIFLSLPDVLTPPEVAYLRDIAELIIAVLTIVFLLPRVIPMVVNGSRSI